MPFEPDSGAGRVAGSGRFVPDAAPSDPQDPSRLGDLARSLKVGALKLPGQVAGLLDIPAALTSGDRPITKAADWIGEQTGFQPGKWAKDARFSPQYEASRAAVDAAWKPVDQAVADPAASKADVVRALMDSLPDLAAKYAQNPMYSLNQAVESAPGMIAGGGLSRLLMTAGRAPGVAGGLERLAGTWAAPIAGGVGEGAMQAGQVMDEFKGTDQRRAAIAALASGGLDALIAGAGGRVANRLGLETPETLMAKIGDKSLAGATAKGAATAAAKLAGGAVGEGVLQEFPQSMQEQAWQNWAEGKPIGEGVLRAGVEGGITGAMMGAGSNVPGAARAVIPQREDKPAATPPAAGAPPAIPAAEVLDEPKPTAAEKALEPRTLTDLDRVAEIDRTLAAMPAQETGPTPERAALEQERADLSRNWPTTVKGQPTSFSTEAGARVDGQYALIEASDLQASHDTDLRPNPAYPADLQPRDRTRAASEAQIASIVGRLDPARLGQSPTAADGAPIIGADGLVESGNARTIALQRVYRANGQKAENYKAWLREASAAVGLSPEQVDAMQQPVLVRVRTTPVNRAEFARQANASTVAAMSPVEQARADAARIDALDDLRPDDNGDFATSRDFIRRFVGRLPATEQPEMIDAGGQLSASGYARVRNAVLAKAYGDSPALTRMVESMDDNLRNVSRALMIAAPRVAQARAAIKAGRRFDADITPHLVGAVEELSRIKDAGGSVSDALAQTGLTGDERTPEARDLLAFLDENMRRPRRLAEFITAYFDALDAAGDPAQGSLMGEAEPPKTGDLMAAVRRKQGENDAAATAATTARNAGGGQPGKVTPAAPGAAGGSAAAPGGGRGAQGDAAAPAANVAPTAANAPYRAYLLTPSDREKLLRLFPPTHDRVIADHLSAQAIDAMHLVKDGPATGEVVGVFDHHGMQALVVSVNGAEKTATGSYFHLSWSVDEGVRTRNIGPAIAEYGFDRLAKPIKLDLSAGPNYIAPARDRSPGAERRDGESDKEFAKRVIDKRSAPITLPEKHSLYFNTGGAQTIDIADLVSTKTDEENAQGAENGAKRMAAAAAGELSKRGPITVMPSESQPGKYEVVDGNGTLSSVARYGWKSLPATVVTRAEGARMKALDEIAETAKAAAKVTLIDGRPYDAARDNFDRKVSLPTLLVSKVESGIVKVANELADLYHRVKPAPQITAEQRADAEAKLLPRMLLAAQAKAEFDGKLLSIVKETGAIGQMLALIKAIGRAAEKMVVDEDGNVDGIKDLLRATIVVGHYDDAQAVVDAIRREFDVLRIKNRSMHDITGPKVAVEDRAKYAGYSDVMVNVTMPNGTVAEIQVNVPVMMAAKGGAGHRLYEAWRDQPKGSPLHSEIGGAMVHFYDAAFDAAKARLDAAQLRKFPSEIGATPPSLGRPLRGSSDSPSSDALKTEPSGKTTYSSPENDAKNSQPSGNLSGIFTGPSSTPSIVPASGENPKEEWRAFAPETGTLGVPRAEMPQVRAALRPELFEFLQGRGIGHQRVSLPADSLKPTQAEYSPAKTESAGHLAEEQTDRAAVLVSSDGYVLDGHHRWLARAEAHQPVWAIQFDAPIGKLLDAVMQFPGTHVSKDSEGAVTPSARDLAVQDFKDAMGDLGDFLTRHLRAAIVTEADKPKLMPTLVKAADAAIRIVGTDLRRVIAWMRDSFRQNKGALPGWQTIPATWYREAAEKALAGLEERGQQTGLFSEKEQGDLFAQPAAQDYTPTEGDSSNVNPGEHPAQGPAAPDAEGSGGHGGRVGVAGGDAGAGSKASRKVGRPGSGEVRGPDADGGTPGPGSSHHASGGVPAGRLIPAKSGRNYRFTDEDIPTGSWFKRATRNLDAILLLRKLDTEKRQATPDEQRVLAQFSGWGASELANNLFDEKKAQLRARALANLKTATDALGRRAALDSRDGNPYWIARAALEAAGKPQPYGQPIRAELLTPANFGLSSGAQRWQELRERLQEAMTPDEWAAAARSTQYAHYTSHAIVRSMWGAMQRFGFNGGLVFEPGAGTGIFPGLMPVELATNSSYVGVELDPITGGILQHLQPDERTLVESFVDTKLPREFFDIAIGNPPFSATKILADPDFKKYAFSLHDYFFAKTLDRVRPGGIVAFVTSRYTMDKAGDKARQFMAERADLIGAIRLPQTAFKANAGTEVVTDVLFLRKKDGRPFEQAQPWLKAVPVETKDGPAVVNEYFAAHPEMVLGTPALVRGMHQANEYSVLPPEGDIEALFAAAVQRLPADVYATRRGGADEAAAVREIDYNPKAQKEGNYYLSDKGVLMQREGGVGRVVELKSPAQAAIVRGFIPLRDALKQAQYDQLNGGDWETTLAALQKEYKAFVAKHGRVNQVVVKQRKVKVAELDDDGMPTGRKIDDEQEQRSYPLRDAIADDPDSTLVAALEQINDDTGAIAESAFLKGRVLGATQAPRIDTPQDALLASLNEIGKVDLARIAHLSGASEADVERALAGAIYLDPTGNRWVTADEYLSGDVKRKLAEARAAAASDRRYEGNVKALEDVQPAPLTPASINVSLGMNWIPGSDYAQFLRETTGVRAAIEWNPTTRSWSVTEIAGGKTPQAVADWGTYDRNATDLLEHALTGRPIRITRTTKDKKTVADPVATEAANEKLKKLREAFGTWIWKDPDRTDRLVREYNDRFNTTVARAFDGRHLTLPGVSTQFDIFDHVKRGAWRIIQTGNTYLAHAVGSGKTFQAVIAAMEMKRLGLVSKPMVVVPNHMLQQFSREWQELYPAARLMVADEQNFHTDNRRRFVARAALSDLDGIIITHSAFKLLDIDPEYKRKVVERELDILRAALEDVDDSDRVRVKQIERQIENLEQKLDASMSSAGKDQNARFDELGVDFLFVDEAHEFRKLDFATARQVKGIQPQGSARALDLFIKTRWLEEKHPGRSLVMMSGTPITNTVAELYSVQKFMDFAALERRGIDDFDSWAAMFGRERTELEPNAAGAYEPVTRFSDFVNVPELTQMFREFADVLTAEHLAALLGDMRPAVEGGARQIVVTPKSAAYAVYQKELAARVEASRKWKPSKDEPANPDPLIRIIGDGRLAAIDMRFIRPGMPNDPDSKLNRMIDAVIEEFKAGADAEFLDKARKADPIKGNTMMVFSDLGFGAGVAASRGFNARAWFEKRLRDAGVPASQYAFMSDYKKSTDKAKLFKDVNAGRVRILIGSSKNMGTGVNAQQRLKSIFHLDSPWYPSDLEQREGRAVRKGNQNKSVRLRAYATKGTYDENMWKMLATKQLFIDKALSGDATVREIEDLSSLSQFDMAAAMVAEDPRVIQLAGAKADVERLNRLYSAHEEQRFDFRKRFRDAEATVASIELALPELDKQAARVRDLSGDKFVAAAGGTTYTERVKWGQALIDRYKDLSAKMAESQQIGEISGFPVWFRSQKANGKFDAYVGLNLPGLRGRVLVDGPESSPMSVTMQAVGGLADLARAPTSERASLTAARNTMDALRPRLDTPFPMLEQLSERQAEVKRIEADLAKKPGTDDGSELDDAAGAVLGSIGPAEVYGTRLSTAPAGARAGGMKLPALQALADRVAKALPGLPPVKVLASSADAPAPLREFIASRNAAGDVEGALHDGTIYLFADNLADEGRAEHVLAQHEAAHAGLRGLMDEAALQQSMRAIYATNAAVRRAARSMVDAGMSEAEATEEVLVDMPSAELATLKGWRAFVGRLRDGLRARGFERLAGMLDDWLAGNLTQQQRADLFAADLVRAARGFVARPQARRLADDAAEQGAWMDREAKARGFSDIDALVAADFALFDRIAQQWRAAHPAAALLSTGGGDPYARAVKAWKAALSRAPVRRGGPLPPAGEAINMPMPTVMLALGVKNPVLALPLRYLHGIVSKHPDLPRAALESLPELLSDPPVVFPAKDGGYRVVLDVRTAKDEPVVVGIGADGRIQTVTPLHDEAGSAGADRLAHMLDQELSKQGVKVYARNKEALASARASRGIGSGASDALAVSSVRAGPAIRALLRSSRDRAIVILRDSIVKRSGDFGPGIRLSSGAAATPGQAGSLTPAQRAEALIQNAAGTPKPLDAFTRMLTRVSGLERLTTMTYGLGARLIDRITPERVKAGLVSDYGVPEAVIDQRAMLQGRQREQLRDAGKLLEKLSTMTRAESRVAYEWMNGEDTRTADELMAELPAESVAVLRQVRALVDELSQEAVKLGQLDPEAFERHRFAYLRRSYFKHAAELTGAEKTARQRAISILGDQYRGRGISLAAPMRQIQNIAPEWWKRKLATGKADTSLKGEKFERLERRAPTGEGTAPIAGVDGERRPGRVMEVHYWPAGEPKPAKYADWDSAGTFEAINVKGGDVVLWRDFTKEERVKMGEIDEARYAIAKTLQRMIHDVEVGKYLRWLSRNHARNEGEPFAGTIVPASERYLDSFKPHEWVRVPDATIAGTNGVKKYGALAGKYLPGPIWNDLRQVVGGRFMPLGQTYHDILRLWKTSKTALSPAVHMNNVMANAIMADWHDVSAGHVAKALRIVLGASARDGRGVLGRAGNAAGGLGIADREVAREILTRYENSGGAIGGWVTQEIADEQLAPIVDALRRELATTATAAAPAEIGVYAALQHALHARFPLAWQAFKASRPASAVATDAKNLIDLYQAEDDVFRLAAWLKAKEGGASDADAGKVARRSFLDYSINAPWVQAMRSTAFPFISFSYRAVPMLLETAAKRPHKILKLMMVLGAINAIGGLLAGGGGDDEDKARKLLPDEKAGRVWGLVPKLIRMPWNDAHGSPVFLDIRRWIPVGDVLDLGQGHAALPLPPALLPGGPLAVLGEILANRSMFTGKPITLETDTATEQAGKIADHLWKAATPNVLGMPGTYATQGVADALRGRTDAFGRELSVPQALASSVGVKLGSYPVDVLRRNRQSEARAQIAEIDDQMRALTRQRVTNRIDQDEYEAAMRRQNEKKRRVAQELAERVN